MTNTEEVSQPVQPEPEAQRNLFLTSLEQGAGIAAGAAVVTAAVAGVKHAANKVLHRPPDQPGPVARQDKGQPEG